MSQAERSRLREAVSRYYEGVDWALDLRAADTKDMRIENVPPTLVRRDPELLLLVWAKDTDHPVWHSDAVRESLLIYSLEHMQYARAPAVFLTPSREGKHREHDEAAVRALRAAGIVDDSTGVL